MSRSNKDRNQKINKKERPIQETYDEAVPNSWKDKNFSRRAVFYRQMPNSFGKELREDMGE
jgi:hypothetical protein